MPDDLVLPPGVVPDVAPEVPVTPRDAATVMLLRDGDAGVEVFLQRRVQGMAFAGGMTVFPGGGVDPRDADASIAWAGPPAEWWAERFACPPETARALVCAAVRETFEESGVLLAGPSADAVVADTSSYLEGRRALVAREVSLARFLGDEGLVLRADLLRPWANWVTPVEEPRRYDTRFFVAVLPGGQRADGWTTEAADAVWQSPSDALADWRDGRRMLMPPTRVVLSELAEFAGVSDVLVAPRAVEKIVPKVVRDGDEVRVVLP
ncbi:NUDIX hydrolase [Saccharothrix australiensis]|uniref:NUDIX hydrolase n=1 Tax=Saccharothrix australiensis TaxID=2072 RepID=UPI003CCC5739